MEKTRHDSAVNQDLSNPKTVLQLGKLYKQANALRQAMETVMAGSTPDHAKWFATNSYVQAYNRIAKLYHAATNSEVTTFDEGQFSSPMKTLWPVQKGNFDQTYTQLLLLIANLSEFEMGMTSSVSEIVDLLSTNLRKVIFEKPQLEYHVQNAVEALLIGRGYQKGVHYDREAGKIKYSGKEFIPDFHFQSVQTALEVKLIREDGNPSSIVEQLSADIPAYKSKYSNVIFCVYDLGALRDVNEFQSGFEDTQGIRVCVVKH